MTVRSSARITLSVVSHGQGALIYGLFADLRRLALADIEIVLTLNIPEDEAWLDHWSDLPIRVIRNAEPRGFGSNHNQAFAQAAGALFCVVNPDIRLPNASFVDLGKAFADPRVASSAPLVLGPDGAVQDSARSFPTIARLARRILLRRHEGDYAAAAAEVDWTAGMLVMFRREAFAAIGGFDERYFMYLEDADICRRLWQSGWKVTYRPDSIVVHNARRASHGSARHLRWHLRSMVRFVTGF